MKQLIIDVTEVLKAPAVDQPDKAYVALAKKLVIPIATHPSPILLQFALSELSIGVYDLQAVRKYLIEKRPERHMFRWIPASSKTEVSRGLRARFRVFDGNRSLHGAIGEGPYNKPIPFPVLETMEAITEKAKELSFTPSFYVSDYALREERPQPARRVDPFLAVGTSDSDALFVIERWDEPGFREETYASKKRKASGGNTGARKKGVMSNMK